MGRRNIYFKEKIEREVFEHVQIEIQNGATHGDINFSSVVNELVDFALRIKNAQKNSSTFDETGYKLDLIRKVAGTREGSSILIALISEMYLMMKGTNDEDTLGELINSNLSSVSDAEDKAEARHFLTDDETEDD